MNKFTLRKLILSLLLSFSINNLNCMQATDIEPDSELVVKSDSQQAERNLADWVRELYETVIAGRNIYEASFGFSICLDLRKRGNKNFEEFKKFATNQFAELIIKKIMEVKLAEYKDADPIRLLFDKGITVYDIKLEESQILTLAAEEEKPCHLATLPNELYNLIFIHGIDGCIDSIELITLENDRGFINRFLFFWGLSKQDSNAIEEKRRDELNGHLSSVISKAISFITNIMKVNKCFYLFGDQLIYRLKKIVSHEFLQEKIVDTYRKREALDLIFILLDANKIDVNYNFKRFGRDDLNLLILSIKYACVLQTNHKDLLDIDRLIKSIIGHGSDLRNHKLVHNGVVLRVAIDGKLEDLAIYLVEIAPIQALDKYSLQIALAHDMQRLINVMKKNGAIITLEDIEESEKLAKEIESCNQAEPSLFSTCLVC